MMTQYEYYTTLLRYILEIITVIGVTAFVAGLAVFIATFYPLFRK